MLGYALRRVALGIPVILGVMTLAFLIVYAIPGDPALFIAGEHAPPDVVQQIRVKLGLDQPIQVQYWRFMSNVLLRGDFGTSLVTQTPVGRELARAFPNTLVLTLVAVGWAAVAGLSLGTVAAVLRGSILDRAIMSVAVFGVSFPGFSIALLLLYVIGFKWGWLPLGGRGPNFHTWDGLRYLVLPAIALGFDMLAPVGRMTRASLLDTLTADYVRTARAKGLPERSVVLKHALRPGLLGVMTILGVVFARLLSGAVVVETVFAWPGVGRLVVASVLVKDMPMIQGVLMVKATFAVALNLAVDLAYGIIDPRIRYQ